MGEAVVAITRITNGNFRLTGRLIAQIQRLLDIYHLSVVTSEVVEAACESLVLASAAGKQVPDALGRGAQPVPLVVIAQQHLRHGQADQLRVGYLRRLAGPDRVNPSEGMIRSVSST
jgi:hypothetical protein